MEHKDKTKDRLLKELSEARQRLDELEILEAERRRVEEALRESEDKYRTIFETTGTATVIIEADTTISLANKEFANLSGYAQEEVEGKKSWADFIPDKDDLDKMMGYHRMRRIDPGAAPRNYEFQFKNKMGSVKHIFATFAVIPGTERSVGSFLDITERKQAEKALQESESRLRFLSSQLLNAQENERKRIAQELHDGIGQILTAIKFGVEDALNRIEEDMGTGAEKPLNALVPVVQNAVEEVRGICMDLRPSMLDDLGILATISWFCREFTLIYSGIQIERQVNIQEGDIPDMLKVVIFRVMQEAVNNAAKHSGADLIRLSLRRTKDAVELSVRDNGCGFESAKTGTKDASRKGLGLASMKERAELSGGSFTIESTVESGTTIRASWSCT